MRTPEPPRSPSPSGPRSAPRRGPRLAGLAAAASLLAGAHISSAQAPLPSFDARTFRPTPDPSASLVYEPVTTPGAWQWNVGASLAYAHRAIVLSRGDTTAYVPLQNQLALDLAGGLGLGSRGFLGFGMPLVLAQEGSTGLPPQIATTSRVPTTALGDFTLFGKASLIENRDGGFGLAALANLTLPTGNREAFVGEGSATALARVLASYSFILAEVSASLGYKVRTERRTWPDERLGGATFGDEIPYTLSLVVRPSLFKIDPSGRQRFEVSLHGAVPAGPVAPFGAGSAASTPLSPALLAISDRVEIGRTRDVYLVGGVDIGLTDAIGVPSFRGVVQIGWSPRSHDEDQDGVPDDVDQCRQIPEDRDGFEDEDGCPEIDDDDDGIVDKEDACPRVAGVESRDPKRNGCPIADRDKDEIPDDVDRCPDLRGARSDDPTKNGCPLVDADGDGVSDDVDKCPDQAEDKDGFEDDDGCPEPDNDKDGVPDAEDMCPLERGVPKANAKRNGCPAVDADDDTFDDEDGDACVGQKETWNGVADDDGCPDEGGKALLTVDESAPAIKVASPFVFAANDALDAKSLVAARALAAALKSHPGWTLAIAVRPQGKDAEKAAAQAMSRALALESAVASFRPKDGAVETIAWEAAKGPASGDPNVALVVRGPAKAPSQAAPKGPAPAPSATAPKAPPVPPPQKK